jgi:hypothetical protein
MRRAKSNFLPNSMAFYGLARDRQSHQKSHRLAQNSDYYLHEHIQSGRYYAVAWVNGKQVFRDGVILALTAGLCRH